MAILVMICGKYEGVIETMKRQIIIEMVDKLPKHIKENDVKYWDYPVEELTYLLEQIGDGLRVNNCKFLLFDNRLYECQD